MTEEETLLENALQEGFVDGLAKIVGNKVQQQISVVNNTATALTVIYKAVSNPQYLETVTFLLKKSIKEKIKVLADGPLKKAIIASFPQGRGLRDFLRGLCLICVINACMSAGKFMKAGAADQASGAVVELAKKIVNIDTLLGQAANGTGILSVMKALEVGDVVLFQVLTRINAKIAVEASAPQKAAA